MDKTVRNLEVSGRPWRCDSLIVLATMAGLTACVDGEFEGDELAEAESAATIPACASGTWCMEASPTSTMLYSVWAASANDVFAVGSAGTILRRQNSEWLPMASGTTQNLRGIWGTSSSNVWVAGAMGTVLHFDGAKWSPVVVDTTNNLNAVWMASANDIFMAGGGSVLRSTNGGATFTKYNFSGSAVGISGSGPTDVWVSTESSYVRRFNGSTWSTVNPGAGTSYFAVHVRALDDTLVASYTPTKETMQFAASKWTARKATGATFQRMHAASANDVWGVGMSKVGRWNGSTWTITSPFPSLSLYGVGGAAGHVWAVGDNGAIAHYAY
jgi:hypothetical protein